MTSCVTLKCIAGAHLGQKFRLEAATVRKREVWHSIIWHEDVVNAQPCNG